MIFGLKTSAELILLFIGFIVLVFAIFAIFLNNSKKFQNWLEMRFNKKLKKHRAKFYDYTNKDIK